MIEIYRRGIDKFLLDLPSGLIENNEKPHETAKRELLQETGDIRFQEVIVAGRLSIWDGFIHGPQNLIKNHIYF
jgi:8-oxo-dGTP pyrophosphatase MutT (NUDIX family)